MPCRRLEQMLKRYERGELAATDWLDALALARIRQLRTEVGPCIAKPPPLPLGGFSTRRCAARRCWQVMQGLCWTTVPCMAR